MPSAAVLLAVAPNSAMRESIAVSITTSTASARPTRTSCSQSNGPAGSSGSRAERA
ncbi:Uncharacterised protein [Mycobacteroides abscessus subsp. abscessus]|nr:Uncharacterised protein [Mycobacteroides abscessus subsp. abscessus]